MKIRHTITFSSVRGVPDGSEDGPYGDVVVLRPRLPAVGPLTTADVAPLVDVPAGEQTVDSVLTEAAKTDWKTLLTLPFMAYLAASPRLPGVARLIALGFGVNALFGKGGILEKADPRASRP